MFASERMAICFRLGQGYNLYLALLPYCLGALLSLLSLLQVICMTLVLAV